MYKKEICSRALELHFETSRKKTTTTNDTDIAFKHLIWHNLVSSHFRKLFVMAVFSGCGSLNM